MPTSQIIGLRLQDFSPFGRAKSSLSFGNQYPDCKCFNYSDLHKIIYRTIHLFPEKGNFCKEKGNFCREKGNFCREKGNFCREKGNFCKEKGDFCREKINFCKEKENFGKEKGNFCTETEDFGAGIGNLHTETENSCQEKLRNRSVKIELFSNQQFSSAIHPSRVLYSCQTGFQVHKTKTSARLASPDLVNVLFIN